MMLSSLAPPPLGGLTTATNTTTPIRHPTQDFFEKFSGTLSRAWWHAATGNGGADFGGA
ncbi:hypothetical protein [Nocardia wallacei]|uniref:hypothetical protein n=1 Tax=Nocardia wallacei TaxID=480035 RepID=UPI0024573B72|nr:hypothetical protein [Nocardia wallacei]